MPMTLQLHTRPRVSTYTQIYSVADLTLYVWKNGDVQVRDSKGRPIFDGSYDKEQGWLLWDGPEKMRMTYSQRNDCERFLQGLYRGKQ